MTVAGQTQNSGRVLQVIRKAWTDADYQMRRMNGMSEVKPGVMEIFRLVDTDVRDEIKIEMRPVVFKLPERRNHGRADLFVVVQGWLVFEGDFKQRPLLTKGFGTRIGYFREKNRALDHVYGGHYDMDEVMPGHPIFHAQMASQVGFAAIAIDQFKLGEQTEITNHIGSVLSTVRTPSAQMDVFSVFTQLCADHLLGEGAGDVERDAFRALRESCDFLIGAAHRLEFLHAGPAAGCYRATHWYKSPKVAYAAS